MIDIGFLPVQIFLASYFLAYFFGAPRWLRMSIAIPMGIVSSWSLIFGLHLWIPADVGRPLNKFVPLVALAVMSIVLARAVRDSWRRRQLRLP